jgi:DsbC/DsbD-like thiol-disulfide interchange protein
MRYLLPAAFVTLLAGPALAGATPWQELTPGVKARMISSDSVDLGKTKIGLELDLPEGFNTYFRIPGDSGIPPVFDFSGSTGLGDPEITWPYPIIEETQGLRDYVYRGHLVLPMQVTAAGPTAQLNVAVTLGVCSDICMPARARFSLPITFGKGDAEQSLRLQMAEVDLPGDWAQPQPPFGPITASAEGLVISGIDPMIDPASIIADVGDPSILFSAPQKSADGVSWILKIPGSSVAAGLAGKTVQLLFTTRLGPFLVSRQIAPAS